MLCAACNQPIGTVPSDDIMYSLDKSVRTKISSRERTLRISGEEIKMLVPKILRSLLEEYPPNDSFISNTLCLADGSNDAGYFDLADVAI